MDLETTDLYWCFSEFYSTVVLKLFSLRRLWKSLLGMRRTSKNIIENKIIKMLIIKVQFINTTSKRNRLAYYLI